MLPTDVGDSPLERGKAPADGFPRIAGASAGVVRVKRCSLHADFGGGLAPIRAILVDLRGVAQERFPRRPTKSMTADVDGGDQAATDPLIQGVQQPVLTRLEMTGIRVVPSAWQATLRLPAGPCGPGPVRDPRWA